MNSVWDDRSGSQGYSWGDVSTAQTHQSELLPTPVAPTSTAIVFAGDVFLGRDVEDGAMQYGYTYPLAIFEEPVFASADAIVINFEAPIPPNHKTTPDFGMNFSVATSAVPALQSMGVTHVGLANNHTNDFGVEGLKHTRQQLIAGTMQPFGDPERVATSSVTLIDTVQGPVAVVGIHAVFRAPDMIAVRELLAALPEEVAAVVAYVHWGDEYQGQASETQEELALALEAAGVDVIIGHHPHVVQNISQVNAIPVLYSLGNTVFDQYFSLAVQNGFMVTLELTATERFVHLHPISSLGSRTRPYLMPARERDRFLADLAERADTTLSEQIIAGTLTW